MPVDVCFLPKGRDSRAKYNAEHTAKMNNMTRSIVSINGSSSYSDMLRDEIMGLYNRYFNDERDKIVGGFGGKSFFIYTWDGT